MHVAGVKIYFSAKLRLTRLVVMGSDFNFNIRPRRISVRFIDKLFHITYLLLDVLEDGRSERGVRRFGSDTHVGVWLVSMADVVLQGSYLSILADSATRLNLFQSPTSTLKIFEGE